MLGSSAEETAFVFGIGTGRRSWLMDELDGWNPRYALRAVMLAFPEPTSSLPSRTGQAPSDGRRCPCHGRGRAPQ